MSQGNENRLLHTLEESDQFQAMPAKMQDWILESPNATRDFAGFFRRGGAIESGTNTPLPYYKEEQPPKIYVNEGQWSALQKQGAPEWPQRHLFGTLAHEIGHDRFNTGTVPFTGRTAEHYVQYRSGLEAQAVFNAFPIFKDLERNPAFNPPPFESVGYLQPVELGAMYGQWRRGELDDRTVVDQIASKVADAPYKLGAQVQDMDRDGIATHRDNYLQDFERYIKPKLEPQASRITPDEPNHPDHALLEKLQDRVRGLDLQAGKGWDDNSERMAASALIMAKKMGFTAQDDPQLAFNRQTERYAAGEILHVFRDGPNASQDPAANRAHMPTAEALSKPAQARYQEVEAINQTQAETLRMTQQLTIGPDDPSRGGPVMRM